LSSLVNEFRFFPMFRWWGRLDSNQQS